MKNSALSLSLICFLCFSLKAQKNFLQFSLNEHLPQSQVFALQQDHRGYLWAATQGGGVGRFDGAQFEVFSTDDGLPSNYVYSLFEDSRQNLWVGTNHGVAYFDGHRFVLPLAAGFAETVNAFFELPDQRVLLATDHGIFSYAPQNGSIQKQKLHPQIDDSQVFAFFKGINGLWAGTANGAWLFSEKTLQGQGLPEPLLIGKTPFVGAVRSFTRDRAGRLWIGTLGSGILVANEATRAVMLTSFREAGKSGMAPSALLARTLSLLTDAEGNIWAGTQNDGVAVFGADGKTYKRYTETQGLPHNNVRHIVADRSGMIWIATSGGGVGKYTGQQFAHFSTANGLAGDRIYALCSGAGGKLYFSASQSGIHTLDSAGFRPFARDSGWLDLKVKTLCEDRKGRLWAGTEGKGLVMFDSTGMHKFNSANGLPSNWVLKILQGQRDEMWAVTFSQGITRIEFREGNFQWKNYGLQDGLPELNLGSAMMDDQGRLWAGTSFGKVYCLKNGKVEVVFGRNEGLPEFPIKTLALDKYGKLWAGTTGAGLFAANLQTNAPVRFDRFDFAKKLSSQNIYFFIFDQENNAWAGCENGVNQLVFNEKGEVADLRYFGKNEGFLGIEACHDAALCQPNGMLWFGTVNGLTQRNPGRGVAAQQVLGMHFRDISLFYKPLDKTPFARWADPAGGLLEGLRLPWDQNHLSFEFRGVDLAHPERIRYRWKLEGAEGEWSPLSEQSHVNYTNLPPGDYRFVAEATSDGVQFSAPLTASFAVLKPFWQHWWFQVMAAALLIGGVWWLFRRRVQNIQRKEHLKREQLEIQNRLLQLEQKALQLQMNPHFIFNALNSIQSLISTQDYSVARQEINGFAKLMRSILTNSRRQTISLREEADTLEQYLRMEQFCQKNEFTFSIHFAENIDPEEIEMPPMLLQPFVENAVVHGVSHLAYPGKINIAFDLNNDLLECTITDNGIGREKATILRESKNPGHQSAALQVTRERLEAMRGQGAHYVPLEFSDVLRKDGSIGGTRVVVRVAVVVDF